MSSGKSDTTARNMYTRYYSFLDHLGHLVRGVLSIMGSAGDNRFFLDELPQSGCKAKEPCTRNDCAFSRQAL